MSAEDQPVGVHVGAGGDPLILGLPVFAVGSFALAMGLLGVPAGLGVVPTIISMTTAFFLFVTTLWAIILGISIVAAIMGIFSGFWFSLSLVLIGGGHDWFGISDSGAALSLFAIAYAVLFACLFIPCLKLPKIYPLIVALAVIALAFVAAGALTIAAYFILAFAVLGFYSFVAVALVAMGGEQLPIG